MYSLFLKHFLKRKEKNVKITKEKWTKDVNRQENPEKEFKIVL